MKNKFLLLLLQVSFMSCQSPGTEAEQQGSLSATPPDSVAQAAVGKENSEYLDWRSLRINGKYPLATSVRNMDGLLGKPDSVNTINWNETCFSSFRSEASRLAYYGGYDFEQFGDSLDFLSVNFRRSKDTYIQSNDLRIDASTTFEEIQRRFPNAAKDLDKLIVEDLGEVDVMALPPSRELADGHWLLMFQKGKLVRIDNWFPC